MLAKLKQLFIYGDLTSTEYAFIKNAIATANYNVWTTSTLIIAVCFLINAVSAIYFQEVSTFIMLYLGMFVLLLGGGFFLVTVVKKHLNLILPTVYVLLCGFFCFGIAVGSVLDTVNLAATFDVILFCAPLLVVDRPWRICLCELLAVSIFIILCLTYKTPATQFIDIYNAICFFVLAQIVNMLIVRIKLHNLLLTKQIFIASQKDELTDLYNRNAYENYLEQSQGKSLATNLIYCSFDVNGLKHTNDTLGHQAGDELLQGAATCIRNVFGQYGKLYRLGGDEFAAIIYSTSEQFRNLQEDFTQQVNKWQGSLVGALSISLGSACVSDYPEASFAKLIKLADDRMYAAKAEHYRRVGVDRRSQARAYNAICNSYTKVLEINITDDTYKIISLSDSEAESMCMPTISGWLYRFGTSVMVHEKDRAYFLERTSLDALREYFAAGNTRLHIFYRRKSGNVYKKCMMEMVVEEGYDYTNQKLFLYVKNID